MTTPRLLVTGFGPFPGMPRNPSAGIARGIASLARWRNRGIDCRCLVVPTAYTALDSVLAPVLAESFDAVLMIGVAGRSRRVRVEMRALNRLSVLFPDAAGAQPRQLARKAAPALRRATFSPRSALASLRRAGIDAHLSHDAGRYLCNAGYFSALAAPCPVLFIHIPKSPRWRPVPERRHARLGWEDGLAFGFAAVALGMLSAARLRSRRSTG